MSLTNTDPKKIELFAKFPWPRVSSPFIDYTLPEAERIKNVIEGDEIKEADLTENAQKAYTLTAYSQRHRYRIYAGPESLVTEPDAQTG